MGEGGMIEEIDKHWTGQGEEDVWGSTISKYPGNAISDNVARFFEFSGISFVVPTACSGGNYAIGQGYDIVRKGITDLAIVGGSDHFSRIALTGFNRLFAMAPDICQPFDKNRKGMMLGEGAGILILEELESAGRRGANIYAEVLGYGLSCDANHMTAPRAESVIKVMERAIKNGNVKKEDVDYISAHGTGTPSNDKIECGAINTVFKDSIKNILTSSIKSMLGHTMGAASAIEAIACCLTIKNNIIPPTINYETPDPECDINCVPNKSINKKIRVALNNSFAFGGNNACAAFKEI
jgi:3-oxoacyl-[acyl-carrier-protein] synthase II